MPSQSQSVATGKSRLKRRAGTQQPAFDYTVPETSSYVTTQDMRPEITEVYEQAMSHRERRSPPPKRARLTSVEESSNGPTRETTPASTQPADGMDVDGEEQLDFVEKTLRQAAKAKKEGRQPSGQLMPPPSNVPARMKFGQSSTRTRSPSEEPVPLEPPRKGGRAQSPVKHATQSASASKDKEAGTSHPPATQDTAFLKAIAKNAKSRRAIDELDKEFNQLRIPKPGAQPGSNVVKASTWDASHPDWNIVNDFDDDLRGNFIEIIRVDLMRKDGGRKQAETADDGRPNFKKFKKVSEAPASFQSTGTSWSADYVA